MVLKVSFQIYKQKTANKLPLVPYALTKSVQKHQQSQYWTTLFFSFKSLTMDVEASKRCVDHIEH
jgi:hypothetical protein